MRSLYFILFYLISLILYCPHAIAFEELLSQVCPLCTMHGIITCPNGLEAACIDEVPGETQPKCLFYENKYVPGCLKFVGIKKLDLNLLPANMPPSIMINIIGGGETYTLNREIIECRAIVN